MLLSSSNLRPPGCGHPRTRQNGTATRRQLVCGSAVTCSVVGSRTSVTSNSYDQPEKHECVYWFTTLPSSLDNVTPPPLHVTIKRTLLTAGPLGPCSETLDEPVD